MDPDPEDPGLDPVQIYLDPQHWDVESGSRRQNNMDPTDQDPDLHLCCQVVRIQNIEISTFSLTIKLKRAFEVMLFLYF